MNILMNIWRDLVHAGRSLAKARAFTFVCVVTLGIGMTPVIAIQYGARAFTTPPPSVNTDGLVEVFTTQVGPQRATDRWSYPDYIDLRDANTGVSMSGWATGGSEVTLPDSGDVKTTAETMFVSSNYFRTMGVALARGPGFMNDTADPVVILGYTFWQRRLAADPDIVGKTITLAGTPHDVVGIAADRFGGPLPFQDAELFLPLERHPSLLGDNKARFDRSREWVRIHGRLAPGAGVAQASAAVSAITSQLAREHAATNEFRAGVVAPYHAIGNVEASDATVIMAVWHAMTAIPLLVVCLNVSGMVQVRSAMRERELSIRQAIGASRGRLIQHLLAEAVVLAAVGGTLASLVLFNIPPLASWWVGEPLPPQLEEALRVDVSMLAITAGLCLATSLLFGWLPAVRFSRPVIMTVLKDEAGGGGFRAGRAHRLTSALQVAIAVPLLVLSFVSIERVRATATADLGFACDLLYAAPLELDAATEANIGFQIRRIRDSLAKASGVASVTVADGLPLDFRYRVARVSTQTEANVAPKVDFAHVTRVGDGYLDTMGIALLRGRGFAIDDGPGAEMVTVISKTLADKLFPDAEAIGQRLSFGAAADENRPPRTLTVVGVTADFPTSQMSTDREQLLLPLAQHPDVRRDSVPVSDDRSGAPTVMLIARSAAGEPPAKLTAALENAMRDVDPDFDRASIVTGAGLRQSSMDDFLNMSAFGGISGGVALLLAALGIYGVVGLMVTTRTREIAVRVTLGASRPRVIGMILFDVVKLVAPGVAVGLLIPAVLVHLEGGIAVSNIEPLAYVAGGAIAVLTAVVASLAPARRAASVQPMVAMRST
ncbi:MAG TPA: ABC transporter permease [Vicinamibacterales bacterium]|nr:ABC transporter permease [Vicinamibacterales bacterium]